MADARSGTAWFVNAVDDGEGFVEVAGNDTAVAVVVAAVVALAFEVDHHVGVDVGD